MAKSLELLIKNENSGRKMGEKLKALEKGL